MSTLKMKKAKKTSTKAPAVKAPKGKKGKRTAEDAVVLPMTTPEAATTEPASALEADAPPTDQPEGTPPTDAVPETNGTAKKTKRTKKAKAPKEKKMSALDAAAKVLEDAGEPMNTKEMIEAMATMGLWKSPGGLTPHATLYSAILREVNTKGKESRFTKTERGKFAFAN